jgi:2-polyprenyl-3-methyl-5-hydroxy-6-metoxy-1,4-benzoquinol methylase
MRAIRNVTLGPSASEQWLCAPDHLAMVLARYRAAAALIGTAKTVLEVGCGEGIGARLLAHGREYLGVDPNARAFDVAVAHLGHRGGDVLDTDLIVDTIEALASRYRAEAIVALDVIEHVADGAAFIAAIADHLVPPAVCVIGTPSASFDHLASPQSRAAHINTYTHARLHALMARYFLVVQSFGMQDTSLHLGHPDARHYLLMCGVGLR